VKQDGCTDAGGANTRGPAFVFIRRNPAIAIDLLVSQRQESDGKYLCMRVMALKDGQSMGIEA
jgi:hypothetical protein